MHHIFSDHPTSILFMLLYLLLQTQAIISLYFLVIRGIILIHFEIAQKIHYYYKILLKE